MAPVILLLLTLLVGAAMAFKGQGGGHTNSRALTIGLVLFGSGAFGLLIYVFPALYAGIAVVAALLVAGWASARSPMGAVYGIIAIVIIVVIGLIFRFTPATEWLVDFAYAFGNSASEFGKLVTSWIPE